MPIRFSDLWCLNTRLTRMAYLSWGVLLFIAKYLIDRIMLGHYFGVVWEPWGYLFPRAMMNQMSGQNGLMDERLLWAVLGLAIPFAWAGSALTLARLRSAMLPGWLVLFFFLPPLNLVLIIICLVAPPRLTPTFDTGAPKTHGSKHGSWVPHDPFLNTITSTCIAGVAGLLFAWLGAEGFGVYGLGLFVGAPFCLGLITAILVGYHHTPTWKECVTATFLALLICAMLMLVFAFEGLICVLMAAPIWVVAALVGTTVGYAIQRTGMPRRTVLLLAISLSVPGMMGAEALDSNDEPPLLEVISSVDIAAPPSTVWRHVVSFEDLPVPTEWLFKTGLAYPMRARITGRGVGAIRRCVFSTGPFVEPIELWDEPRTLRFAVTENPPPMKELSFYDIHPPHLEGYLVSEEGQFNLIALPNGGTRLEGTTWYRNHMWPTNYWRLWSDFIIHRIHLRVLTHIRTLAEMERG